MEVLSAAQGSGTVPAQNAHNTELTLRSSETSAHAQGFLILHNISKRHNIGTLLRSATAFNVSQVCLVGNRQFSSFGDQGTTAYANFRHFADLDTCCQYLKEDQGCTVLGIEIAHAARPIQQHPFIGSTAFMLGNEGTGLSNRQMNCCDGFIYIPQHGPGTASLNVTVAASIVLHHFAIWAGMPEAAREGAKYVVAPRPQRTGPRGAVPFSAEEIAARQEHRASHSSADQGFPMPADPGSLLALVEGAACTDGEEHWQSQ